MIGVINLLPAEPLNGGTQIVHYHMDTFMHQI